MIPLFKSDYSIGKSILTLEPSTATPDGPISIFSLAEEGALDKVVLVEDSLTGFLKAQKTAESLGVQLVFGLRISICSQATTEIPKGGDSTEHKIIIFARNAAGCKLLNKIYSWGFTKGSGRIDCSFLKKNWNEEDLHLCIPFYDSFIFNNLMSFHTCVMDFSFAAPTFFIEDNSLPFDALVRGRVESYCHQHNYSIEKAQTIYYNTEADFAAYQTYKCICKRSSFGRGSTLAKPNLDHCGSSQFSFESWQQKTRT
jgi:DNA polymerase III alpha subunit